jgi:P-type Cu+ transporter
MTTAQIIVTLIGGVTIAVLARFFFRPRVATEAVEQAGVQEVRVVVRGGYSPDVIRARTGLPLRIVFDRQEDGDCSSRVVFADLALSRFLAPFAQTTVVFTPTRPGSYGFACGMNMIHGTVLVAPLGSSATAAPSRSPSRMLWRATSSSCVPARRCLSMARSSMGAPAWTSRW